MEDNMNKEEIRKFRGKVLTLEEDIKYLDELNAVKKGLETPEYTSEFQNNFTGLEMKITVSEDQYLSLNIGRDFLSEETTSKIRKFFEYLCVETMNSIENDMRHVLDTMEVSDSIPNAKKGLYDEDDDVPSI